MNKKVFFFTLFLTPVLFSCDKGNIRYGVSSPFITLENGDVGQIKDVMPSAILDKIEKKDTFLLLIHSSTCSHCKTLKEETLDPYLEKHPFIFYGLEKMSFSQNEKEESNFNELVYGEKGRFEGYLGTPYVAIFEEGKFIVGEQDLNYVGLLLDTYLIVDPIE